MRVQRVDRSRLPSTHSGHGFDSFFVVEHPLQVRRAFLLLGDRDAAHDVVAAAFEQVYRRWDTIVEPGPYLHRCVLNGCRDAHGRRRFVDLAAELPDEEIAAENGDVELALLLVELPFRQRAALVLRFYGGMTEREIAELLQCRPGTVGPLISRGLARLRKQMP